MSTDEIYIADGYEQTRTMAAVPGLHPELVITYRPALGGERHAHLSKLANRDRDPKAVDEWEAGLIGRHHVTVNGAAVPKDRAAKLKPAVRGYLMELILGYAPADEAADAGN